MEAARERTEEEEKKRQDVEQLRLWQYNRQKDAVHQENSFASSSDDEDYISVEEDPYIKPRNMRTSKRTSGGEKVEYDRLESQAMRMFYSSHQKTSSIPSPLADTKVPPQSGAKYQRPRSTPVLSSGVQFQRRRSIAGLELEVTGSF